MSDETLHTAARRVVRFFHIDMAHGGLVSIETQKAIDTLDVEVRRETDRQKEVARLATVAAASPDGNQRAGAVPLAPGTSTPDSA